MKVLRALGRMLLDVLRVVGKLLLTVSIFLAYLGLVYCAQVRHEIVAIVIYRLITGAAILLTVVLLTAFIVEWFRSHYR